MFWQKEPKNLKIIVLIIVMCVVFGTIFLIYSQKKPKKSELPSEIEVIETETGKIVRNRAEGYEVTIPKEWHIDATKTQFYSSLKREEVCKLTTHVSDEVKSIEEIKKDIERTIKYEQLTVKKLEYSEIVVSGYPSLKQIIETDEWGYSICVYIPTHRKLYRFEMAIFDLRNIKKCTQYMDNFLKTVSIK